MAVGVDPLFDPVVVEDPHDYYAQLRATDPVHEIPGTGTFLVTRMDLIQKIVADPAVFSSESTQFLHVEQALASAVAVTPPEVARFVGGGGAIATADPPAHTRQRKVVVRRLSAASMQAMEPEFRELAGHAIDDALPTGRMEWMGELAEPLPMIMVGRILGLPDEAAPKLKEIGYAGVESISGFVTEERRGELALKIADLGPVMDAYKTARSSKHPDPATLIGVCAQAVTDGEISDAEAFSILMVLIAAGGESTTSLTGTAVRILAEQPDLQRRLRSQPRLIPTFVEEACRIDPPFRGHYRRVTTDTELGGVKLPAGSTLVLSWPAANRDSDAFANPDDIDLDRPNPHQHVGFGWGIHYCVGAPLARVEARVALELLLARTVSFSIDPSALPLRHHLSLMIRRLKTLPLILET